MQEPVPVDDLKGVRLSLVQYTHFIYGLHAIAVLIGVTSAATVAGGFVFGLPSLVAVFLNYLKRGEVSGTWLESHFRWQIRTFWFTLLWLIVYGLLIITIIGIPVAWILIALLGLWVGYRVIRGWTALFAVRSI
uniref:Transmembrane protein n=1 Tax=Dechloromonas aromatica (strain RCB) TaxID=159087 RepID=Q47J05_DECAR